MTRTTLLACLLLTAAPLAAQEMVPATLDGHALIPANTMSVPPADAPRDLWVSGKFTARDGIRADVPGSLQQATGLNLPFLGQPLQGISGFAATRDAEGNLYALIDNGFGTKRNSPDAMLGFLRIAPDFATGEIEIHERVWLSDPDRIVPFRLSYDAGDSRYLTGGDFDLEGMQIVGETVWIGDEFGPYLISATLDGRVTGVYPTRLGEVELRSPDHPGLIVGAKAGVDYTVPRSGGYEGLALTPSGDTLWGMLEKPLIAEDGNAEGAYLRVLAFDPVTRDWTGDSFKFALTEGAVAIGDFNFIDDTRALVIERDGGQGDPSLSCADGQQDGCFAKPAQVKRVTLIDTAQIDADGFVARLRQIDLMDIADPNGTARLETDGDVPAGRFTFPFVTIESVLRDGPEHILVGNDNNLPFSAGRRLDQPDANEMIRLHVPELLAD